MNNGEVVPQPGSILGSLFENFQMDNTAYEMSELGTSLFEGDYIGAIVHTTYAGMNFVMDLWNLSAYKPSDTPPFNITNPLTWFESIEWLIAVLVYNTWDILKMGIFLLIVLGIPAMGLAMLAAFKFAWESAFG
jgi:hypothetical protein